MGERAVRRWLTDLLVQEVGFAAETARRAVEHSVHSGGRFVGEAASVATTAMSTSRLPGGRAWWVTEGQRIRAHLLDGAYPDEALAFVGEVIAGPAPDWWDPNWPGYKVFTHLMAPGAAPGDEYVVGNGEGVRGRVRVVERDGKVGAVIVDSWWSIGDLHDVAWNRVEALYAEPDADE